jgi:hypothetical protein
VANSKAEGTMEGAAEGEAGRGVRAQRRHRRQCVSREAVAREMGGEQKRATMARRPDPTGRGERSTHGCGRRRPDSAGAQKRAAVAWRPDPAGARKRVTAARQPNPDGGGERSVRGRTTGCSGGTRWRTAAVIEGGK